MASDPATLHCGTDCALEVVAHGRSHFHATARNCERPAGAGQGIVKRQARLASDVVARDWLAYCMNHPWLTTSAWPVSAFDGKLANMSTTSATSRVVVNSRSTVAFSMTFWSRPHDR
jgi:hypothetical protein